MRSQKNLRSSGDRVEQLLDQLQAVAEPQVYQRVSEVLWLVSEIYAAGLGRILEIVREHSPEIIHDLADDDLVASILLVHGLHPESLESRVESALDGVRPLLAAHGGDVELLGLDEMVGAVRLRLLGSCDGCPSSAVTLQMAVERAINESAPEVIRIDVEEPSALVADRVAVSMSPRHVYSECPTETAGT